MAAKKVSTSNKSGVICSLGIQVKFDSILEPYENIKMFKDGDFFRIQQGGDYITLNSIDDLNLFFEGLRIFLDNMEA